MKNFFILCLFLVVIACASPSNNKLEGSTSTAVGNPNLPAYSIDEEKVLVKAVLDGNVTIEAKSDFIELDPVLSIDNVETEFLVNGEVKAKLSGTEFLDGEILFKVSVPANKGDLIVIHVRVPKTVKEDNSVEAVASEVDTVAHLSGETMSPISKVHQDAPPPPAPLMQPLVESNKQECSANVSCSRGLTCYLFHCYTGEEYDALMKTQSGLIQEAIPQQESVQTLKDTAATINNVDNQLTQNKLDTQIPLPQTVQINNSLNQGNILSDKPIGQSLTPMRSSGQPSVTNSQGVR